MHDEQVEVTMKKWLIGLALLAFAGLASAQTIPVWVLWSSSWVRWDGGPVGNGPVGPYSGTPVLGDIIYFNGTNWVSLNKPADGTYSVTFTAGIPSWAAGGGGGLGDPGANGVVVRTALNTTTARTLACTDTYCNFTNGNGVSGAPTLNFAITPGHEGGAIAMQATTPGTQQGSAASANINFNGTEVQELDALAATGTDGIISQNTTAASGGTTVQLAPSYKMCGTAWNSGGSASETDCWRIQDQPVTQAGTTTSNLRFLSSIAGGAFTAPLVLSNTGTLTATNNYFASAAGSLFDVTGTVAGSGGFELNYQNSGIMLMTGNRLVSASCTSGTTCDSTTNIPANAVVLSVAYRVTTTITGPTSIGFGTANNATAFCSGLTTLTSGNTGACGGGSTNANGVANPSSAALRITATGGSFSAGVVEFEITYILVTPPTS